MKKNHLFSSILALTMMAFTASVFAQVGCPTVEEIRNNAYLFDTVYHAKTALPKNLVGIAKENDIFSSKQFDAAGKKWNLLTQQFNNESDDNANILQAQVNAREVAYGTGIINNIVPGKYEFKACMYQTGNFDGTFTAIYTKGKLPVKMQDMLFRLQHSALA